MSLTATALKTAAPGLSPSQLAPRATREAGASTAVARVGSPSPAIAGRSLGLDQSGVQRAAERYLQAAKLGAHAEAGRWGAVAEQLDIAKGLTASQQVRGLGQALDAKLAGGVERANGLLAQIGELNNEISRLRLAGGSSADAEAAQDTALDQLSALIEVRTVPRANGGVTVRSLEGILLAAESAGQLSYNRADPTKGYVAVEPQTDAGFAQPIHLQSGELRGLLDLRDAILPGMAEQLDLGPPSEMLAELGAAVGGQAQVAAARRDAAQALAEEALSQRQSMTRLDLETEVARLGAYQQAAAGSARMGHAARELLAVLSSAATADASN